MLGKIIVGIVIVFLIVLSAYLIHDSQTIRKAGSIGSGFRSKVNSAKSSFEVKNTNAPVICIKARGETIYEQIPMTKKSVKIGRSSGSDIVLEDDTVEGTHAIVRKVIKNDKVYYEFVNLSRRNPAEYFNPRKNDYDYIGYKKGIVLGSEEVFYIGETKVLIKTPVQGHKTSKTERMVMDGQNRTHESVPQEEKVISQESEKSFVPQQEIDL